jgi:hypothetical protein
MVSVEYCRLGKHGGGASEHALGVSSVFDAGRPIWQLYCRGALGDESEWLRLDATDGVWGGLVRWVRFVLAQREEVWRLQERQCAGR